MPTLKPNTNMPSDKEDQEIIRQAIEDGTYHSTEELHKFRPAHEFPELGQAIKRAGRPKAEATKTPVSIRLSTEVVDYFKSTGKGWQTRVDAVLKDYVASHEL